MAKSPRTITILGKSGSGKDTQVESLAKKLSPALIISTGKRFREIEQSDTLAGKKTKEVLDVGGLMPAWFASYLWQDELVNNLNGDENILFGSNPRRVEEAEELDEVIKWLGRDPVEAVLLDIPDEESLERMIKRGREDDNEENIKQRLSWFHEYVESVAEHYQWHHRLHVVDGVGPIKEIHKRIKKVLKIK